MNVLLLSAGFGTRLGTLTKNKPKCLMEIKGVPILKIWLDNVLQLKPRNIFINTHYLSQQVFKFISENYSNSCIKIIHEKEIMGTAGTLFYLLDELKDDNCLLAHTDNFLTLNLKDFEYEHNRRPTKAIITALVFNTNKPQEFGIFKLDKESIAIAFHEKVKFPPGNIANAAVYLLSPVFINSLSIYKNKGLNDFSKDIIPLYLNQIYCFKTNCEVIDIGTPNNLYRANNI
jgi:mannose-1-phosphate guanylyltransferase